MEKERKFEIEDYLKKEGKKKKQSPDEFTRLFLTEYLRRWKGQLEFDAIWTEKDQIAYEIFVHIVLSLEKMEGVR